MNNSVSLRNEAVWGATEDSSFNIFEELEEKEEEEEAAAGIEEILLKTVSGLFFCF